MAREAFLVNPPPPPRTRSHTRTRNPLGEEALIIGGLNPPKYRNSWPDNHDGHSRAAKLGWSRRKGAARYLHYSTNPIEEEGSMATQTRTRRRRRKTGGAPKRRVYRRRRTALANPPKRRRYRRRRTALANPPKRRRYRRSRSNPIVRHTRRRRHYRRNPPMERGGVISLRKPATLIMPILTGVVAMKAMEKVPTMLNLTGNTALAAQAGVMVGGGLLLPKVVGRTGAAIWVAVCGAMIVNSLLNQYVFKTALSGLGDIPYAVGQGQDFQQLGNLGAFPNDNLMSGLGAYPYEMQY